MTKKEGGQPTIKIKSYQQMSIIITMPKTRYKSVGSPEVGEILGINIQKLNQI